MADSKPQFGRLPAWVLRGGYLTKMNRSDICVFYAICITCGGQKWKGYASDKKLAELSSVSIRTIERVAKRLSDIGLIRVERGKWRGHASTYQVIQKPDITLSAFDTDKARQNELQSPTFSSPKADKMKRKARQSCVDPSDITERTDTTEGNCVDVFACEKKDGVRVIAGRIGIKEPSLSTITQSGITPQGLIAWATTAPESVGNLAGYLVNIAKRMNEGGEGPPEVTAYNVQIAIRNNWLQFVGNYQLGDGVKTTYNDLGLYVYRDNELQELIDVKQLRKIPIG